MADDTRRGARRDARAGAQAGAEGSPDHSDQPEHADQPDQQPDHADHADRPDQPGRPDRPARTGRPDRFDGQKVLIVDDDLRGVYALTSALTLRGLAVAHASNGQDGIAALRKDPDIRAVLLDIAIPGLDGYATAAGIRGLAERGDVPIVAVTFEASAADRARCLAAGMDEHVAKPVDVERLLRVLSGLLGEAG